MTHDVQLLALHNGLAPYADSIICDDLTGPGSLLGEAARVPRPVCVLRSEATSCLLPIKEYKEVPLVVLWQERALNANPAMSVAATTYLAGECTSTFDVAWALYERNMLPEWGAVVASVQKQGRGQLRRQWHSPRGNLYVSFRLPKDANLAGDAASLVVGYILAKSFASLGFTLSLKWPNDLLSMDGKKVGGILLEERDGVIMAGLGVNLIEAPCAADLRRDHSIPASVLFRDDEHLGDEPLAPFSLWQSLVDRCLTEYTRSVAGKSLGAVLAEVNSLLAWKGQTVTVSEEGQAVCQGRCAGLGPGGGLLLIADDEPLELFSGSLALA